MSAFAAASQGERVAAATLFTALPKPTFSSDSISMAHGKRVRTSSADPSVDALSTTQI